MNWAIAVMALLSLALGMLLGSFMNGLEDSGGVQWKRKDDNKKFIYDDTSNISCYVGKIRSI
jgi:hypothetical protein